MKTLIAIVLLAAGTLVAAGEPGLSDSALPEGVKPWWPSRYGPEDQLGTLNEITGKEILAAAKLVKKGEVIDLGRVLDDNTPKFPGRYWQQTADATAHFTNLRRTDAVGKGWGKNQINWIIEIQTGTFQVGNDIFCRQMRVVGVSASRLHTDKLPVCAAISEAEANRHSRPTDIRTNFKNSPG